MDRAAAGRIAGDERAVHRRAPPVYVGYILGSFGAALLFGSPLGLAVSALTFVYYDLRTRWEDRELRRAYPGFEAYQRRVRGRLLPGTY